MQEKKLFDAEWNLMCFIWENHPTTASQAAAFALKELQWKKNTTYTVIKRLIQKEFLQRQEPGFFIIPLVEKQQMQQQAMSSLLEKRFDGNVQDFLNTLSQINPSKSLVQ